MQDPIPMMAGAAALLHPSPEHGVSVRQSHAAVPVPGAVIGLHSVPANRPDRTPFAPAKTDDLPFRLIALFEIKVSFGVMHGDILATAQDLVIGDGWSFRDVTNLIPADSRLEQRKLRVTLSELTDLGPTSLVVSSQLDLVLMSHDADVVRCQHVGCKNPALQEQGFLLMPAGFDTSKAYELIDLAG